MTVNAVRYRVSGQTDYRIVRFVAGNLSSSVYIFSAKRTDLEEFSAALLFIFNNPGAQETPIEEAAIHMGDVAGQTWVIARDGQGMLTVQENSEKSSVAAAARALGLELVNRPDRSLPALCRSLEVLGGGLYETIEGQEAQESGATARRIRLETIRVRKALAEEFGWSAPKDQIQEFLNRANSFQSQRRGLESALELFSKIIDVSSKKVMDLSQLTREVGVLKAMSKRVEDLQASESVLRSFQQKCESQGRVDLQRVQRLFGEGGVGELFEKIEIVIQKRFENLRQRWGDDLALQAESVLTFLKKHKSEKTDRILETAQLQTGSQSWFERFRAAHVGSESEKVERKATLKAWDLSQDDVAEFDRAVRGLLASLERWKFDWQSLVQNSPSASDFDLLSFGGNDANLREQTEDVIASLSTLMSVYTAIEQTWSALEARKALARREEILRELKSLIMEWRQVTRSQKSDVLDDPALVIAEAQTLVRQLAGRIGRLERWEVELQKMESLRDMQSEAGRKLQALNQSWDQMCREFLLHYKDAEASGQLISLLSRWQMLEEFTPSPPSPAPINLLKFYPDSGYSNQNLSDVLKALQSAKAGQVLFFLCSDHVLAEKLSHKGFSRGVHLDRNTPVSGRPAMSEKARLALEVFNQGKQLSEPNSRMR